MQINYVLSECVRWQNFPLIPHWRVVDACLENKMAGTIQTIPVWHTIAHTNTCIANAVANESPLTTQNTLHTTT